MTGRQVVAFAQGVLQVACQSQWMPECTRQLWQKWMCYKYLGRRYEDIIGGDTGLQFCIAVNYYRRNCRE